MVIFHHLATSCIVSKEICRVRISSVCIFYITQYKGDLKLKVFTEKLN